MVPRMTTITHSITITGDTDYIQRVLTAIEAVSATPPAPSVALTAHLDRIVNRSSAPSLMRKAHEELTKIGYVVDLPASRSSKIPDYLRVHDPVNGLSLGYLKVSRFTVSRSDLRAELSGWPGWEIDGNRYASVRLSSQANVDSFLALANREKA